MSIYFHYNPDNTNERICKTIVADEKDLPKVGDELEGSTVTGVGSESLTDMGSHFISLCSAPKSKCSGCIYLDNCTVGQERVRG